MAKRNKHKLAILLPRGTLTDSQLEKLRGMVKDRQAEIRSAFGTKSAEIYIEEDKISFPWFEITPDESRLMEYIYYVNNLCIEANLHETRDAVCNEDEAIMDAIITMV